MSTPDLYPLYLESEGISTDTRSILKDSIYFALKGDHFDGNTFVFEALEKGALAAVCDDPTIQNDGRFKKNADRIIITQNSLEALQKLAHHHRKTIGTKAVIGITGSNGKTTTKELIAEVLQEKFRIVKTEGNLNNHIGVPLTLLRIKKSTEIAIIEMGANHIHEIKELCTIAEPTHGVITNIGSAHLEGFGSKDGVAKAKGALYEWLRDHAGTLFINKNDPNLTSLLYKLDPGCLAETIRYGDEEVPENKNLFGSFNKENMRTAMAIGKYFKIPAPTILKALRNYVPKNMRGMTVTTKRGNKIILDAYNANPSSMRVALESFAALPDPMKWVILGDMKELGEHTEKAHKDVLNDLSFFGLSHIILIGEAFCEAHSNMKRYACYKTKEEFLSSPFAHSLKNATVFIKGSNSMRMWEIADQL